MKKIRSQIKTYGAMLKRINVFLLDKKSKKLIFLLIPMGLLMEQLWVVDNYILGQIVNKLSGQVSSLSGVSVFVCAVILAGSYLLADFIRYVLIKKGFQFRTHLSNKVEGQFWNAVARIELQDKENPKIQNILDDARRNYGAVNQIFGTQMTILSSVVTLIASSAVLAFIEWWYLILIIGMVLPGIYFDRVQNRRNYEQKKRFNEIKRYHYELSDHIGEKETFVHSSTNYFLSLYQSMRRQFLSLELKIDNMRNNTRLITSVIRNVLMIALYLAVFIKIGNGVLQIGSLFLVFSSIKRLESNLGSFLDKIISLEQTVREASDFFAIIDMKSSIQMPKHPVFLDTNHAPSIEFDNVWFKYPGTECWVLKGVSFKIAQGERVGLVGENGSGKTTISLLVLRFYDPDKGSIRINGIDLRLIDREQLFSMSGVVFQDFNLFRARLSETIRVYNHTLHNHSRVIESAKAVEMEEYIYSLPNQFDTKIGTFYEGGIKLSGGQQQKVAIAGLIYRDAKFVILDEPTSDLSPTAEQKIIEQYKKISEGKTGLIIFHRYKALQLVDRIMVLEEGVIIEQGTHSELMVLDGSYAVLFRAAQLQTD